MLIEIPADAACRMTGRCGFHGCELKLIPYADDGLDTALDAWECPALPADPDLAAIREREKEACRPWPVPWDRQPEEVRAERMRLHGEAHTAYERCRRSWVICADIP
jgi:hypothetical protein